ncbi:uncharacterized protein SPPG_07698 [Spizellomyces punctatus DAOM BR117]|uniref:RING-type domain-containing protein n=1 Tax=Spizellomyces punctatus (strain DAOM BR117) TaxID=645134 RepID=A0A0L0H7J3_SPIPD|nr:uncharacterized protein SPPG_07698 [Spizellomyces punctatus DAOM BR117]KNC96866.1 hypothetical protein SPPG_07698 [Spizellomyces punctatus DAOM BR117]|eukprot:XP_016604906.1 hypothetical protein SPPG_07698 [Spizellomyces punctatus DAOM BR117]
MVCVGKQLVHCISSPRAAHFFYLGRQRILPQSKRYPNNQKMSDLFQFYARNRGVVVPDLLAASVLHNPSSQESPYSLLALLGSKFDLRRSKGLTSYLVRHPDVLEILFSTLCGMAPDVVEIERHVMSLPAGSLGTDTKRMSFVSFLEKCETLSKSDASVESLYKRLLDLLEHADVCFVCMDRSVDIVFECGHVLCEECSLQIFERCPFCRRNIKDPAHRMHLSDVRNASAMEIEAPVKSAPQRARQSLELRKDKSAYLVERIEALQCNTTTLDEAEKTEWNLLVDRAPDTVKTATQSNPFRSQETKAWVCAKLILKLAPLHKGKPWTEAERQTAFEIVRNVTTPSQLHRFLAVIAGNDPTTDAQISRSMPRKLRTLVTHIVNNIKSGADSVDFHRRDDKGFWKMLFAKVHITEKRKRKRFAKAQATATVLRTNKLSDDQRAEAIKFKVLDTNGQRPKTSIHDLNVAIRDRDVSAIVASLSKDSGLCFRYLRLLATRLRDSIEDVEKWRAFVEKMAPQWSVRQLIELKHIFVKCLEQSEDDNNVEIGAASNPVGESAEQTTKCRRVILTRKGSLYQEPPISDSDEAFPLYPRKDITHVALQCLEAQIESKLTLSDRFHGVLLEDTPTSRLGYRDRLLPRGNPPNVPQWALKQIFNRGDFIPLPLNSEILAYIYWKQKIDRVDLDLSVFGVDEQCVAVAGDTKCDYTSLDAFGGAMQHSGDLMSAPNGASEYVRFRIRDVLQASPQTRYLVVSVFSYNKVAFDNLDCAIVGAGVLPAGAAEHEGDVESNANLHLAESGPASSTTLGVAGLRGSSMMNLAGIIDCNPENPGMWLTGINVGGASNSFLSVDSNGVTVCRDVAGFLKWRATNAPPSVEWVLAHAGAAIGTVAVKKSRGKQELENMLHDMSIDETTLGDQQTGQNDAEDYFEIYHRQPTETKETFMTRVLTPGMEPDLCVNDLKEVDVTGNDGGVKRKWLDDWKVVYA